MSLALLVGFGGALLAFLASVGAYFQRKDAAHTGELIQTAAVNQQSAVVATAIAQAVVAAPTTKLALVDQLKAGKF